MKCTKLNPNRISFFASMNLVTLRRQRMADTDWSPAVEVSDAGDEYLLEFNLPRLAREEIEISVDGDALFLVGQRMSPRNGEGNMRAEHPIGAFARRLVLPPDSCRDAMYATLQDGLLELHVPKSAPHTKKEEPPPHSVRRTRP